MLGAQVADVLLNGARVEVKVTQATSERFGVVQAKMVLSCGFGSVGT